MAGDLIVPGCHMSAAPSCILAFFAVNSTMEDAKLEALHDSLQDKEQQRGRRGGLGIGVVNGFRFAVPNFARKMGKRKRDNKAECPMTDAVEKKKRMKEGELSIANRNIVLVCHDNLRCVTDSLQHLQSFFFKALYSRFVPAGAKVRGLQSKRILFDGDGVAQKEDSQKQQQASEEQEQQVDAQGAGWNTHAPTLFCM